MKYLLLIGTLLTCLLNSLAGQIEINGIVKGTDGEVLQYATIFIIGTEIGTTTDLTGSYALSCSENDTLQYDYIGFESKKLAAKDVGDIVFLNQAALTICPIIKIESKYRYSENYESLESPQKLIADPMQVEKLYNQSTGIFMHSGAPNTNRITIRGIGSRSPFSTTKIKAYLNQIPLTNGIGETNLENLNLGAIDEVVIFKGAGAIEYGAGLGGLIYYNTNSVKRDFSNFGTTIGTGSYGKIFSSTNYNYSADNAVFSLNHSLTKSEGFRDNNNFNRNTVTGFANVSFNKDELTVFVDYNKLNAQIPSGLNIDDFNTDPSLAAANWKSVEGFEDNERTMVGITHARSFISNLHTSVTGFLGTYANYERRPFNTIDQENRFIGTRVSIKKEEVFNSPLNLGLGTELFRETEKWSTYETLGLEQGNILSDNKEIRFLSNTFITADYRISSFEINGGLNVGFTKYDYADWFLGDNIDLSGDYTYQPIISPKLAIGYSRKPNERYYAKIAHGYSTPTLEETLLPSGVINPDINPETGWNAEIGMRKKFEKIALDADVSIYYLWVNNLIVSERVTEDQFQGINAGKTEHPGVELALNKVVQIAENSRLTFYNSYTFSPHRFKEFTNNESTFDGNLLPGLPSHKNYFKVNLDIDRFHLELSNLSVSKMFADDGNSIEVASYNLLGLRTSYDILNSKHWKSSIHFAVDNLLNQSYASMISVNPRSFGSSLPRYLYSGLPLNFTSKVNFSYTF